MKTPISYPVFLLLALVGMASAGLPNKPPITKYNLLWTNSPFTSKPPLPEPGPENNPLDDYALIGVSSLGTSNYRVTLINKKKPDEPRIYVETNRDSKGFKIIKVTRKEGDPLGTVVTMQSGTMTGTVSYEEKLLTLTAVAPKAAPPPVPGGPQLIPGQQRPVPGGPQVIPGQQVVPGAPQRQPRPRVVPPPAPAAGGQPQPGQPQPGQVQPGQPIPAAQQNRGNAIVRPERRGN